MAGIWEQERKLSLFAITWPIFIELSLHMLMGNIDTFMLSRYNDNAVAAVGVSNQIISMVNIMFGFVASGTTILVSRYLGAQQKESARQVATTSLTLNFMFGLFISLILLLYGKLFLTLLGLQDELMPYATVFLSITGGTMFVQAVLLTASAVIKSHGFTRNVMAITVGMNLLNILGNYLSICGPFGLPVLGVAGVAGSTAISRTIGLTVMIVLFLRVLNRQVRWKDFFQLKGRHIKDLLHIGIPSAGEQLSHNSSQLMITSFIAMIGVTAMITRVYTFNIIFLITIFTVAISQGTQILVARMIGAKQYDLAYKQCLKSLGLSILICLVMLGLYNLLGVHILDLFTDDPEVIESGRILLLLAFILEPGRAFNLIIISSLKASGDVRFPVYIGIFFMWGIAVPSAYWFGIHMGMGLVGIFIAFIVDEWVRGLIMLHRWLARRWMKQVTKEEALQTATVTV